MNLMNLSNRFSIHLQQQIHAVGSSILEFCNFLVAISNIVRIITQIDTIREPKANVPKWYL